MKRPVHGVKDGASIPTDFIFQIGVCAMFFMVQGHDAPKCRDPSNEVMMNWLLVTRPTIAEQQATAHSRAKDSLDGEPVRPVQHFRGRAPVSEECRSVWHVRPILLPIQFGSSFGEKSLPNLFCREGRSDQAYARHTKSEQVYRPRISSPRAGQ
jgi:hypothetical protein